MSIFDLKIPEEKDEQECKGRVYRCTINQYYSSYGSIEVRKSLRLLKRDSCPGCEKCDWIDEYVSEDLSNWSFRYNNGDYLNELIDGKKYKLITIWHPGTWEYPNDGELEINFVEVK